MAPCTVSFFAAIAADGQLTFRTTKAALAVLLLASGSVLASGGALAHECSSYDRDACNPDSCRDGENHHHTHMRHWWEGKDEYCQSKARPERDDCYVGPVRVPDIICEVSTLALA